MLGQGPGADAGGGEPVRIGIAGCGRMAERGHVPAASRARGVLLAAVADPERSRCERAAPGVPAYGSPEELAAAGVEAAIVATPTADHLGAARALTGAGVPVLVEKPPAHDAAGAAALAALPAGVWVGFNRRFDPDLVALRERLGTERTASLALLLDFPIRAWRPHVAHDDALLDLGTHLVDLARWLLGADVIRIRARALTPSRASLDLDLGETRAASISCAGNRFWRERVTADGESGRIADHPRGGLARVALQKLRLRPRDDGFVGSLARQLEALAAQVRGSDTAAPAAAADGVAALAAVDAARESARAGGEWRPVLTPEGSAA